MKPATIFGLAVRLVGLFLLYKAVMALTGFFTAASVPMSHVPSPAFLHVMMLGAAAVWFLFGAPPIQDWAYSDSRDDNNWKMAEPPRSSGPFCVSCGKPILAGSNNCPACGWTQPG